MNSQTQDQTATSVNKRRGRSHSIQIGSRDFPSKETAKEYFRSILYRYALDSELTGNDLKDVQDLLSCHPAATEKIGIGLEALYVGRDEYSGRCFHLRRTDGTTDNFSMKLCRDGEPPARTRFSNACRFAVKPDISDFRKKAFNDPEQCVDGFVKCAKTGAWVSSSDAHIDHAEPLTFSRVVRDYILLRGIDLETFDAYSHEGLYGAVFSDAALIEDFRNYHREVAVLQVVTKASNLGDAWKGRLDLPSRITGVAV